MKYMKLTDAPWLLQVIDSLREMLGPVQGPATDSASTGVVFPNGTANIIPVDANSIAYGRTVEEVTFHPSPSSNSSGCSFLF